MDIEKYLTAENQKMRKAGNDLAIAALRVVRGYDGVHRLAKAVAEWADTIGNEGGRASLYEEEDKRDSRKRGGRERVMTSFYVHTADKDAKLSPVHGAYRQEVKVYCTCGRQISVVGVVQEKDEYDEGDYRLIVKPCSCGSLAEGSE